MYSFKKVDGTSLEIREYRSDKDVEEGLYYIDYSNKGIRIFVQKRIEKGKDIFFPSFSNLPANFENLAGADELNSEESLEAAFKIGIDFVDSCQWEYVESDGPYKIHVRQWWSKTNWGYGVYSGKTKQWAGYKSRERAIEAAKEYIREEKRRYLYMLARKVADIIFEYTAETFGDKPSMGDYRNQRVNPYDNQTADGLFLELYYGRPSSLWTPWGKWSFGRSGMGDWKEVISKLIERFGMTVHLEKTSSTWGEFGPVYALHKVDGTQLPEPIELEKANYASYEEVITTWEDLTNTFQSRSEKPKN